MRQAFQVLTPVRQTFEVFTSVGQIFQLFTSVRQFRCLPQWDTRPVQPQPPPWRAACPGGQRVAPAPRGFPAPWPAAAWTSSGTLSAGLRTGPATQAASASHVVSCLDTIPTWNPCWRATLMRDQASFKAISVYETSGGRESQFNRIWTPCTLPPPKKKKGEKKKTFTFLFPCEWVHDLGPPHFQDHNFRNFCLHISIWMCPRQGSTLFYNCFCWTLGGGGFFLVYEDCGRMFDNSFPTCAFSFFFKVEISSRKRIPLFRPGSVHSGSVSWDNCDREFPDEVRVSSFPIPTLCLDSSIVSPLRLQWVKGVCVFRCNLPPALLAEWPGSFTCHWVTRGWNGDQIKVSTQSWLWRRRFCCRSCWEFNLQPFDHEPSTLTNKLLRLDS